VDVRGWQGGKDAKKKQCQKTVSVGGGRTRTAAVIFNCPRAITATTQ